MAKNYKPVEYSSTTFESRTYHKNQNFSNTDEGISSIHYRSESLANYDDAGPMSHTISGSHYNLLNGLLFDSSSFMNATYDNVYRNKFPSSGSVIYIPQQYYGEEIKPKSFKLIDDSTAQQIRIVDDGNGNLYSLNAKNSRSAATSISSTPASPSIDVLNDPFASPTVVDSAVGSLITVSITNRSGNSTITETESLQGSLTFAWSTSEDPGTGDGTANGGSGFTGGSVSNVNGDTIYIRPKFTEGGRDVNESGNGNINVTNNSVSHDKTVSITVGGR